MRDGDREKYILQIYETERQKVKDTQRQSVREMKHRDPGDRLYNAHGNCNNTLVTFSVITNIFRSRSNRTIHNESKKMQK